MKTTNLTQKTWLPLLILATILLSACQPVETNSSGEADNLAAVQNGAAFSPAAGTFNLPNPAAALDQVTTYAAVLTVKFDGQQNGSPHSWTRTYQMKVDLDSSPSRYVEVIFQKGSDPAMTRFLAAENHLQQAVVEPSAECQITDLNEVVPLADTWEPAGFLPAVAGAEDAGVDDVRGVAARRYTFDERALGLSGMVESEGEFWLAVDSSLLLRYTLTQQGGADYFGEGVDGSVVWEYELVYGNPTPAWPAACEDGTSFLDLPLLPEAADVDSSPGILTFLTQSTPEEVLAFYEQALAEAGWLPGEGDSSSSALDSLMPGMEGLLDEETLKELQELQAEMQNEDFGVDGESIDEPDIDSTGGLTVFNREGQQLTLSILPETEGWSVMLVLMEP